MSASLKQHIAKLAQQGIVWQALTLDDADAWIRTAGVDVGILSAGTQHFVKTQWMKHANAVPQDLTSKHNIKAANQWLVDFMQRFQAAHSVVPLSFDAADDDIATLADKTASKFRQGIFYFGWSLERQLDEAAQLGIDCDVAFDTQFAKGYLDAIGARLCDAKWWKRQLRRLHYRHLEQMYRESGMVHKRHWLYASDDAVIRRRQQKLRNLAMMQSITLVNELGEAFALSELVDKSNANPAIRRAELMVRIAGFETIARDLGHCGEFITLTCPSRFHAVHHWGGKNTKYDGSTTREASAYLNSVWAKIQAALKREDIAIYGFRVVEPHHDGCPHWHGLFFMAHDDRDAFRKIVARYACREDREELGLSYFETATELKQRAREIQAEQIARGDKKQSLKSIESNLKTEKDFWSGADWRVFKNISPRIDFKKIDWSRGTAAGYIAKYIAKNIDGKNTLGEGIGEDYESADGESVIETAERVDAWASLNGIRQFQQIGGAPVGAWRELRRLEIADFASNPNDVLLRAAMAADAGDWGKFTMLMGGVNMARDARPVQLHKETPVGVDGLPMRNAYGEPAAAVTRGVLDATTGEIRLSRIHEWALGFGKNCGSAAAWTRVNNSTNLSKSADLVVNVNKRKESSADWADDYLVAVESSLKHRFAPERVDFLRDWVTDLTFAVDALPKGSHQRCLMEGDLDYVKNELDSVLQFNRYGCLPNGLDLRDESSRIVNMAFDALADADNVAQQVAQDERGRDIQRAARAYITKLNHLQTPVWTDSVALRRERAAQAKLRDELRDVKPHHKFSFPKQYDTVDSVLAEIEELLNETAIY